jgi:hypothetical protein
VYAQLIGSKRACLICAQDVYTRQTFDGSQFLHDGLSPRKERGTHGHRRGSDAGQPDRNTDDLQTMLVCNRTETRWNAGSYEENQRVNQ